MSLRPVWWLWSEIDAFLCRKAKVTLHCLLCCSAVTTIFVSPALIWVSLPGLYVGFLTLFLTDDSKTPSARHATCVTLQTLHLTLYLSQRMKGCSCRWFWSCCGVKKKTSRQLEKPTFCVFVCEIWSLRTPCDVLDSCPAPVFTSDMRGPR